MGKSKKSAAKVSNTIATNKKARFEYFIEDRLEAGICLEGWEVKSLRDRRIQLTEAYVLLKSGEAWLVGAHISPMPTASTHITPDPTRSRKLLLNRREISSLVGAWRERDTRWFLLPCTGNGVVPNSKLAPPKERSSTTSARAQKNETGTEKRDA